MGIQLLLLAGWLVAVLVAMLLLWGFPTALRRREAAAMRLLAAGRPVRIPALSGAGVRLRPGTVFRDGDQVRFTSARLAWSVDAAASDVGTLHRVDSAGVVRRLVDGAGRSYYLDLTPARDQLLAVAAAVPAGPASFLTKARAGMPRVPVLLSVAAVAAGLEGWAGAGRALGLDRTGARNLGVAVSVALLCSLLESARRLRQPVIPLRQPVIPLRPAAVGDGAARPALGVGQPGVDDGARAARAELVHELTGLWPEEFPRR